MSLHEAPLLFWFVVFLVLVWIFMSIAGIGYALYVISDSKKDILARHESKINHGRETLAKLVSTMGKLKLFAFVMFFLCGLYAVSPWSLGGTGPLWRRVIIPTGLVFGQAALVLSLINFQRERQRVLKRDMAEEAARLNAALESISEASEEATVSRDALTQATQNLADATREQTAALNGTAVSPPIPHPTDIQ